MTKKIKLFLLLAICIFLLSSCSADEQSNTPEKSGGEKCVEKKVSLPEEVFSVFDVETDGKTINIVGFDKENSQCTAWTSQDKGQTWGKTNVIKMSELKKSQIDIPKNNQDNQGVEMEPSISSENEIFSTIATWQGETLIETKHFLWSNKEKNEMTIALPEIEEYDNGIFHADFLSTGELIVEDFQGQVYKIDKTNGKIVKKILPKNLCDIIHTKNINDDKLYVATGDDIKAFSLKTGNEIEVEESIIGYSYSTDEDEDSFGRSNYVVYTDENGKSILSINENGLKKFVNSEFELLLDFKDTILANKETTIYDFVSYDDKDFFLIAHVEGKGVLLNYQIK